MARPKGRRNGDGPTARIASAVRAQVGEFTTVDIAEATGLDIKTVSGYLRRMPGISIVRSSPSYHGNRNIWVFQDPTQAGMWDGVAAQTVILAWGAR